MKLFLSLTSVTRPRGPGGRMNEMPDRQTGEKQEWASVGTEHKCVCLATMFALTVDSYEKPSPLNLQQGRLMYMRVFCVMALTGEMQHNCGCKHEWTRINAQAIVQSKLISKEGQMHAYALMHIITCTFCYIFCSFIATDWLLHIAVMIMRLTARKLSTQTMQSWRQFISSISSSSSQLWLL